MCQPPPWVLCLDYVALLTDMLGLSSADEVCIELYNCTRHGKVDACWAILNIWSWGRLHLPCVNGHVGVVWLLLSHGATNNMPNRSMNLPVVNNSCGH